jgi:putative ABC transport system ATP-binding protein
VAAAEFVAVLGPSGSGKSTLFHLLGLLDRPTSGSYVLAGQDTALLAPRQAAAMRATTIGFLFQSFHLLPTRTATENVMLGGLYAGNRHCLRDKARDLLERVGLGSRADTIPTKLSGGERQRVALARALINDPPLVLCDEPTGNLDSKARDGLLALIRDLQATGVTIMTITHDPTVASAADRRLHIADGVLSEPPTGYFGP